MSSQNDEVALRKKELLHSMKEADAAIRKETALFRSSRIAYLRRLKAQELVSEAEGVHAGNTLRM
jgi:hypothetical protein